MQRHCALAKKPRKTGSSKSSIFGGPNLRLRRQLQETEVYLKLFYDECIEPVVCECLKNTMPHAKAITIIRSVDRELWDVEDIETRIAVATEVAKVQEVPIEDEPDDDSECTPEQYQR